MYRIAVVSINIFLRRMSTGAKIEKKQEHIILKYRYCTIDIDT